MGDFTPYLWNSPRDAASNPRSAPAAPCRKDAPTEKTFYEDLFDSLGSKETKTIERQREIVNMIAGLKDSDRVEDVEDGGVKEGVIILR